MILDRMGLKSAWRRSADQPSLVLGFVGALIGVWFVGPGQIAVGNRDWLRPTPSRLDHAVAQLNWEFLRWAPMGTWPPFDLSNLGVGWSTVYVPFSSGSPFGIVLRYFSAILPTKFQFMGLWLILSFFLYGYFAGKLISRATASKGIVVLGGLLLLTSPVFYYRIGVLGHFELSAHWLIFASILLALESQIRFKRWTLLLLVALIINIYLFVITGCFYLAAFIQNLTAQSDRKPKVKQFGLVLVCCAFAMWVLGFFVYRSNATGLGFFRINLASFIFPRFSLGASYQGSFSQFFDQIGVFDGRDFVAFEREGFGYLGLGVIFGSSVLLVLVLSRLRMTFARLSGPSKSVVVVSIVLFLNSLSNHVVIGRRELLQYPVPNALLDLRQVFRTAERFSWPLYYLIFLAVIVGITKFVRQKALVTLILVSLLVIQIWDIYPGVLSSRQVLRTTSTVQLISSPQWDEIVKGRKSLTMVPVFDFIDDEQSTEIEDWRKNDRFFSILEFASQRQLTTNFSVTGRPVSAIVEIENRRINEELTNGRFDVDTVYVFPNLNQWSELRAKYSRSGQFVELDGFFLIVPFS